MTTPGVVSRVALNSMEDRIRRLYGMAGEIGAQFTPHATISLDAGSLNDPGLNFFDGRSFQATFSIANAAAVMAAMRAQAGCVITSINVQCNPTVEVALHYGAADTAPIAGLTSGVIWTELGLLSTDRAPLVGLGGLAVAAAVGQVCGQWSINTAGQELLVQPIHLPKDAQLCVVPQAAVATFGRVNIAGYVQEGA